MKTLKRLQLYNLSDKNPKRVKRLIKIHRYDVRLRINAPFLIIYGRLGEHISVLFESFHLINSREYLQ